VIDATRRSDKVSLINRAIDIALADVSIYRAWSDLMVEADASLSAAAASVTLASDLTRLLEVRLIDGTSSYRLKLRQKTWLVQRHPNISAASQAKPVYGYMMGRVLYVIPIPASAYTIRYTYARSHPALTSDSSLVLIRHASAAIAAYATWWTFKSIEKFEEAKQWKETYEELVAKAVKNDEDNPAVEMLADIRGQNDDGSINPYWLDPFVRSMP